jgi:8-oxo-dGTP diphosphatase
MTLTQKQKKYQTPTIATDVAIFTIKDGVLQTLLIKMNRAPFSGKWAFPGGLVQFEESLDEAAERHLFSKTNVTSKNAYLQQLYTFGNVKRDPFGRVISVAYYALIPSDQVHLKTTKEYSGVDWFPANKLPPLAYDHATIATEALRRLRIKLGYSNIAYALMPEEFTFSELQKTYEIILDKKIDKRNFRKKIAALGMLVETSKMETGKANRPARLFRFSKHEPQRFDEL